MIKLSKNGKIIIFFVLLVLSFGTVVYKVSSNIEDDVYVVSESEENKKEAIIESIDYIEKEKTTSRDITIFISGEVVNPGVVTIEGDKRLSDAVDKLGGVTEDADLNKINLAIKIEDEQHYIIPKTGENNESVESSSSDINKGNTKININTATIEVLDTLPGVGEATANKILNYREENGMFKSIEEIKNVNGIGDKKFIDLKDKICTE
ncbi:MAG: helix-hairpin-helix domain-containing protein [Peptostreptococcaceae bacterium]